MTFDWKDAASLVAILGGLVKVAHWLRAQVNAYVLEQCSQLFSQAIKNTDRLEKELYELSKEVSRIEGALKEIAAKQFESHDQVEMLFRNVNVNLATATKKLSEELKKSSVKEIAEGVQRVSEKKD